jgi:hypothetical protein
MAKASSSKKSNKGWIVAIIFTVIVIVAIAYFAGLNRNGPSPYSSPNQAVVVPQYYLTMSVSPSSGGTVSPGSEWVNSGSSVTISESPASNYVFNDWTCSGTGCYSGTATSASITMNNNISETANYYSPSTITFDISSMSGTSSTVLTVDGTAYPYSSLPVTISVPYGTSVTYSYASPIGYSYASPIGSSSGQYVFSSLTGCSQSAQSNTFTPSETTCTISATYYTTQVYTLPLLSQGQVLSINPGSYYLVNFTIPQGAYSINVTGSYNSQGKIEVAILTPAQYGAFTQNPSSIISSQYYYGDTQGSTINAQLSAGQYTLIFYDPGIFTQDTVTIVNQITAHYTQQ